MSSAGAPSRADSGTQPPPQRTRRGLIAAVVAAALVVGGVGYAALDLADVVPGPLTAAPAPTQATPTWPAAPAARLGPADQAVLPPAGANAPLPTTAGLAAALHAALTAPELGGRVTTSVADASSGNTLLEQDAARLVAPASTSKLVTMTAALSELGAQTRLPTTVVAGASPQEVVLVGGGDVLLGAGGGNPDATVGHAGLADLAEQTARALHPPGGAAPSPVVVRVDDGAFSGPSLSPHWGAGDVASGFVSPVMALEVNAGRVAPGRYAHRESDPALAAGRAFAAQLAARGIPVTGTVQRSSAPDHARQLAKVESATVAEQAQYALSESDNVVAEALGRLVAVKMGRQPTFSDAGLAVLDAVGRLGVETAGARMLDASGLDPGDVLSARLLTKVLVLAASPQHPELRPILTGLPVAGVTGTLDDRFTRGPEATAAGIVRAKTGSLTGVSTLAGLVRDSDGRVLVFSLMADAVSPNGTLAARAALDRIAATLAGCGCR